MTRSALPSYCINFNQRVVLLSLSHSIMYDSDSSEFESIMDHFSTCALVANMHIESHRETLENSMKVSRKSRVDY